MRIVGSSSSATTIPRQFTDDSCDAVLAEGQSTALIAIEAPGRHDRLSQATRHPSAAFVAHLIATRMQAPQTRERRRAEPDEAIAVYRSMTKPVRDKRVFGARV